MRLKAYTAATIAEAMQQIREELGEDAAIVATDTDGNGVRVVAALDAEPAPAAPRSVPQPVAWPTVAAKRPEPTAEPRERASAAPTAERDAVLARALAHHGVPEAIVANLVGGAPQGATPAATLAARVAQLLRFGNLADRRETSPVLLAGPPGAGKTLVAAKLAARAALKGQAIRIVTTDIGSAGAIEQLTAFTEPLNIELETADGPAALARVLSQTPTAVIRDGKPQVVIDTRGVNPFDAVEMAGLSALIVASRAEATLVLPAGGDAHESAEMAEAFAHIGCSRLVTTRLDIARRLGGILAAATVGRLALAETGASPIVAHGLQTLNPQLLARLFVADRPR